MFDEISASQKDQLLRCFSQRATLLEGEQIGAYRLLNGYYEGFPDIQLDLFAKTLVIHNHAKNPVDLSTLCDRIQNLTLHMFPWIEAALLKTRYGEDESERQGKLTYGNRLDEVIIEHGVRYALDLQINQDASFYLDTRNLRKWLLENSEGKTALNTFAYTGTLGVAAKMGGAKTVIQTDLNQRFLAIAKHSLRLNKLAFTPTDIQAGDFFKIMQRFKDAHKLFDCVILDPPFFSQTTSGRVDLVHEFIRLVNKVRPLVGHEGRLIAINNAIFVSGEEVMRHVNKLCESGYAQLEQIISVPKDVTGYPETIVNHPPVDPAPFNHPTKIVVLKILRKDQRTA